MGTNTHGYGHRRRHRRPLTTAAVRVRTGAGPGSVDESREAPAPRPPFVFGIGMRRPSAPPAAQRGLPQRWPEAVGRGLAWALRGHGPFARAPEPPRWSLLTLWVAFAGAVAETLKRLVAHYTLYPST